MAKARTLVGLDLHANKVVAAVLDAETGELQMFGRVDLAAELIHAKCELIADRVCDC